VGLLFKNRNKFVFFNSNYYNPEKGVIQENASENNPFSKSNYRAIGTLFFDKMILDWLQGKEWK